MWVLAGAVCHHYASARLGEDRKQGDQSHLRGSVPPREINEGMGMSWKIPSYVLSFSPA